MMLVVTPSMEVRRVAGVAAMSTRKQQKDEIKREEEEEEEVEEKREIKREEKEEDGMKVRWWNEVVVIRVNIIMVRQIGIDDWQTAMRFTASFLPSFLNSFLLSFDRHDHT